MRFIALVLGLVVVSSDAEAAPVTNADIEKLLAASMSEGVILNVISGGERQFDTSPDALIALKNKGATPAILAAMTGPATSPPVPQPSPMQATPADGPQSISHARAEMEMMVKSRDLIFVDGDTRTTMTFSNANMREAGRIVSLLAYGFGHRSYWTISGSHARLRSTNPIPVVILSVTRNSHPEDYVTLTRWEPRRENTREIMVEIAKLTGDSVTYKGPDFPQERVIPVEFTPAKDSASGEMVPDRYEMRPQISLKPGEYAVVLMQQVFDFGIDQGK